MKYYRDIGSPGAPIEELCIECGKRHFKTFEEVLWVGLPIYHSLLTPSGLEATRDGHNPRGVAKQRKAAEWRLFV